MKFGIISGEGILSALSHPCGSPASLIGNLSVKRLIWMPSFCLIDFDGFSKESGVKRSGDYGGFYASSDE